MIILISLSLPALIIFIIVYIAYVQSGRILNRKNTRRQISVYPDQFKVPFENVIFKNKDGILLKGWFIPAAQESSKTIILMHGWNMNKGNILANTVFLRDKNYNLFYFDFRSNGESGDGKTSVGYFEIRDAQAAIEALQKTRYEAAREIAVYGISMGAAVAIYEAAHNPLIKAVVAEACYYSYEKVVARWAKEHKRAPYFPIVALTLFFARKRLGVNPENFSPRQNIRKLSGKPIFIINGADDMLAPRRDARKLFAKASEPKQLWIVPNASHTEVAEVAGQQYKNRLEQFFEKYL
ncbi:MAG: alpha/beta hydrolase [Elusimicrobiota bacterium]|nr:alpha/beta hydrolase [Elusimicrobiota bacterium]